MKKLFDWIINKWLAGFITAGVFFVLKLYIDLPAESKSNFFSFNWFIDLMQTKITFLILIFIVFVIIILTRIEKARLKSKYTKNDDYSWLNAPKNHFEKYNSDIFGVNKTKWAWRYEWKPFDQKFQIVDLTPVCKQCSTPMEIDTSFYSYGINAECHKCRLEGRQYHFRVTENVSDVEKEIFRKIQ